MSIDAYWIMTLLGLGRLVLAAGVLYGLACLIFPLRAADRTSAARSEHRWARALLSIALATLLVLGLILLDIYDGLMLAGSLVLISVVVLGWRHPPSVATHLYVRLLEWADHPPALRSLLSNRAVRSSRSFLTGTLLVGIVLGSAILRLIPLLQSPSPFALTHYRLLEMANHLQANQLFPGQLIEARGFHGLAVALHALSGIEMGMVVRLLGVLSVFFLLLGIYVAARGYSGDSVAALGAAGLFGLSLPFLPFAIENQVESTPTLLAATYALPTWYVLLRYQIEGHRPRLWVGGAGIGLLLLTDGSVATLTLGLLAGLGLIQSMLAQTPAHTRRALHVTGMSIGGGLLLGGLAALRRVLIVPDPYAVPTFSVHGADLSPYYPADLSLPAYGGIVGAVALALLVMALTDRRPFRRHVSWALALSCMGLYATWFFLDARPFFGLNPIAPAALLSIFLCVAFGGLCARVATAVRSRLRQINPQPAFPLLSHGFVPGLLLTTLFLSPPPLLPTFEPGIEPGGYARAIHKIQREGTPYQWTVVSHYGTAVHTMNRGRFLSYDYFLQHYDAQTYDPAAPEAIPTDDLFLFVPTDAAVNGVRDELLASDREIAGPMQRWCERYRQRSSSLSLFFEDDGLKVYRLTRPPQTSHERAPLFSRVIPQ